MTGWRREQTELGKGNPQGYGGRLGFIWTVGVRRSWDEKGPVGTLLNRKIREMDEPGIINNEVNNKKTEGKKILP